MTSPCGPPDKTLHSETIVRTPGGRRTGHFSGKAVELNLAPVAHTQVVPKNIHSRRVQCTPKFSDVQQIDSRPPTISKGESTQS